MINVHEQHINTKICLLVVPCFLHLLLSIGRPSVFWRNLSLPGWHLPLRSHCLRIRNNTARDMLGLTWTNTSDKCSPWRIWNIHMAPMKGKTFWPQSYSLVTKLFCNWQRPPLSKRPTTVHCCYANAQYQSSSYVHCSMSLYNIKWNPDMLLKYYHPERKTTGSMVTVLDQPASMHKHNLLQHTTGVSPAIKSIPSRTYWQCNNVCHHGGVHNIHWSCYIRTHFVTLVRSSLCVFSGNKLLK